MNVSKTRISVVHPGELGPAEIATWRSFQYSSAPLANAFLSPDFAIAVGRHRKLPDQAQPVRG